MPHTESILRRCSHCAHEMHTLTTLPTELLYEIQLFARSSTLPQTCKALHGIFASSPPSHRAQYLVARTKASPGDDVLTQILRYPICTQDVLEAYFRRTTTWRRARDDDDDRGTRPDLPRRPFRALAGTTTKATEVREWTDRDPPLPWLRYVYACPHLAPPDANAHGGYALAMAVLAGFVPLVRFLLDHGATPAAKGNLAIAIAIRRRDLGLVRMLVERVDTATWTSSVANRERRKLEDRVKVTSEMLRIAVRCKAQDIVEYLTREKGCIPDMQTLLSMG